MNTIKTRDAGIIFVFAVFFMNIVATILLLILKGIYPAIIGSDLFIMANYFFSQSTFFVAILLFANFRKLKFRDVGLNKKKVNPLIFVVVLAISLIMTFGLNDINILFIQLINKITGFVPIAIQIGEATPLNIVLGVLLIGLAPAFVEELLVRGFVFSGLRQGYSATSAVFLSAFMFAIMHMNIGQLFYQFMFGVIIAILALLTRSLYASMTLHAFNNLIILVAYYCGIGADSGDVSSMKYSAVQIVLAIVVAIASLAAIFGLLMLVGYLVKRTDNKKDAPTETINMTESTTKKRNKVIGFFVDTYTYFIFRMSEKPLGEVVEINVTGKLLDEKLGDDTVIKTYGERSSKAILWVCIFGFMVVYIINLFMQKAA